MEVTIIPKLGNAEDGRQFCEVILKDKKTKEDKKYKGLMWPSKDQVHAFVPELNKTFSVKRENADQLA